MIGSVFQYGYGMGVMNQLGGDLEEIFNDKGTALAMNFTSAISLTYALWSLGGAIGSQIAGVWAAKFGRKNALLLNNVFIIPGILLQVCTFQTRVMSYDWILVGRFINGIGCGVAAAISPVYLAEVAPLHLRGAFGTSYSLFLNIALLVTFLLGLQKDSLKLGGFDTSAFVVAFPLIGSFLQLVILPFCPDSPVSLAFRNLLKASLTSATFFGLDPKELEQKPEEKPKKKDFKELLKNPLFIKPLIVGCVMMIIQQVTGLIAILFYSTTIFKQAGMENPKMGTVIIGGITTFITIVTIVVIDRFGRKVLMLGSITGQLISSMVVGGVLVSMQINPEVMSMVSVVFIYVFVISFQFGVGPIPSFMTAELFDVSERSQAQSISVLVMWISNCIIGAAYSPINEAIGGSIFFLFGTLNIFALIFVFFYVPETKNKTSTEIQDFFLPKSSDSSNEIL